MDWHRRPCTLYRLYNAAEEVLYIGITFDWSIRSSQHKYDKTWWPQVTRHDLIEYPSRISAALAERDAIIAELPPHNIQHHPDRIPTRGVRLRDPEPEITPQRIADLTAEIKRLHLTREEAKVLISEVMRIRVMPRTATSQEVEDARAQQAKRLARQARA